MSSKKQSADKSIFRTLGHLTAGYDLFDCVKKANTLSPWINGHQPMGLRRLPSQGITTVRTEGLLSFLTKTKSFVSSRIERRLSRFDLYWRYAPRFYRLVRSHDVDDYDAPCNPYKIEWVDPDIIQEVTRRLRPIEYNVFGEVQTGDWDIRDTFQFDSDYKKKEYMNYKYPTMRFEDSVFYQSLRAHFIDDLSWEETEFVQTELARIENGMTVWGKSSTREELLSHCSSVDKLYKEIKQEGYKYQTDINIEQTLTQSRLNEILVDVGRDGQLLYVDSRHRLAISKILDLDSVPIAFGVRHSEWMDVRDAVYTGAESASHPDLRTL